MRTSIDLAKNDNSVSTTDPITTVLMNEKRSQNRIRHHKKKIIDELNQNIGTVIKHTNDENLDNNIVNNPVINMPSIGKWMYENDNFRPEEAAIDLNNTSKIEFNSNNESDDDIEVIDAFSAGPSGLNRVRNNQNNDKDINGLLIDCDLNQILDTSTELILEEVVFDMNVSDIPTEPIDGTTETITIDDDDSGIIVVNETIKESTATDDVEIIRVKFLNEPIDSDIEVVAEILSPPEVIDVMHSHLKYVQNLTQLSFTTIRLIMSRYHWNKDLFVNDFFEFGIERLLNHYKLVISYELKTKGNKRRKLRHNITESNAESTTTGDTVANTQELKTCLVCFDESNSDNMYGTTCGHFLCIECWNLYVGEHVNDRSKNEMISCPGDNCPNIIDDEELLTIIQDQNTRDKYLRLMSNTFVEKNPLLKWCPNGDCLHAVRVKENGFQDVECICKTVFCFLCGDRWHEPLSCQQHQNWIQKFASQTVDQKSAKWLTQHTKCCPKCRFPIEKNGGCNYVLCQRCRHQFCYDCLGKCSHGRCLGQNAPDALQAQASDRAAKDDLKIYPTIKNQYQKQSKQFAIEDKLQKDVSLKLEKAVKCPEFKSALKFLKSAFTVLCHCRQTLMYSYVFGYYLLGPHNEKLIYGQNLNHLEKQTEYLSRILTTETAVIQKDAVLDIKRRVQPIYRECEAKRSQLVQHIRQGLTRNCWQFSAISN